MKVLSALILSLLAFTAHATTFQLVPLALDTGYTIKGTIDTDGTVGYLTAANITNWNLTVTQTSDVVYTNDSTYTPPAHSDTTVITGAVPQVSGVSSDGRRIRVQRSPDILTGADGGSLSFLQTTRGVDPAWAMVADFTLNAYNITGYPDYFIGGAGGWGTALGMSAATPLTLAPCRADGRCPAYTAANVTAQPNVFKLVPITTQAVTPVQTLFGTITTDGTFGLLDATHISAWRITGRSQDIQYYAKDNGLGTGNSVIRNLVSLYSDNAVLRLDVNVGGVLDIGTSPTQNSPGISILVGAYTDPTSGAVAGNMASYSLGNTGTVASRSPLTTRRTYTLANAK